MNNKAMERIIERQAKANALVLKEIGEILGKIGELTPSEAYTIAKQLKYGESLKNIVKTLSKYSRLNEIDIYNMLEAEAKNNLELKKVYYKARKMDFIPYKNNAPLKSLVREIAMTTLNSYRNISATTGLTFLDRAGNSVTMPIEQAYWQLVDDAIVNVNMGKESFDTALQRQLETIGNAGIQSIEYKSGVHRRIDSAMRMNLQAGVTELFEREQELLGNQFEYDGWEVTVHENPAEDHEEVQGHQFTNEEYFNLQNFGVAKDVDGEVIDIHNKYGGFRPIGELNCYHEAFTIIVGVSKPMHSKEELKKIIERNDKGFEYEGDKYTMYEGTQLQRKLELEIRRAKEAQIIAKAGNKPELVDKEERRISLLTDKYYELSKASGLPTKLERLKVNGYKYTKPSSTKPFGNEKARQLPKPNVKAGEVFISKEENKRLNEYFIKDFEEKKLNKFYFDNRDLERYNKLKEIQKAGYKDEVIKLDSIENCNKLLDKVNTEIIGEEIKNTDFRLVSEATQVIYENTKKSPATLRELILNRAKLTAMPHTAGVANTRLNIITLNNADYGDYDKFKKMCVDNTELHQHLNGEMHSWWSQVAKGNETKVVITHEMGHRIDSDIASDIVFHKQYAGKAYDYFFNMYGRKNDSGTYFNVSLRQIERDLIYEPIRRLQKKTGLTQKQIINQYTSMYGRSNYREMFAETFANATLGNSNALGDELLEFLKEIGMWNE